MFIHIKHYTISVLVVFIVSCLCLGCEWIPTEVITTTPIEKNAVATITAIDGSDLTGTATFTEVDDGVHVRIEIENTSTGLHATHIHLGSCDNIGPHWHPTDIPAGASGVPVAEATFETLPIGIGEIGNITVAENGVGTLEFTTPFWSVGGDQSTDILNKLILIHETGDTFRTNPHAHNTTGMHTHSIAQMQTGMDTTQATHVCTLAVLGQQIDLNAEHHIPGQDVSPHTHDLLELLLKCFLRPEQLADPRNLTKIPFKGSSEYQTFMNIEPKTLAAYHDFFIAIDIPVDPDFFTNQFQQTFYTGTPAEYKQEMQQRLTHIYITSGVDFHNLTDLFGYNILITNFLDDRTTAWVLGNFQGDDVAFGEWIVEVLNAVQVRPGGGSRIGCGVIELVE